MEAGNGRGAERPIPTMTRARLREPDGRGHRGTITLNARCAAIASAVLLMIAFGLSKLRPRRRALIPRQRSAAVSMMAAPSPTAAPTTTAAPTPDENATIQQRNANARWVQSVGRVCARRQRNGVAPCLRDLLRFAARGGRAIRAVQVGACSGNYSQPPGDEFQKLAFHAPHVDALLVEPVPFLAAELEQNLRAWRALRDGRQLVAVNAAVCGPRGNDRELPFYYVAPRFGREHPRAPRWMAFQLGSLLSDNTIVAKIVDHLSMDARREFLLEDPSRLRVASDALRGVLRNPPDPDRLREMVRNRGDESVGVAFRFAKNKTLARSMAGWPPSVDRDALREAVRQKFVAKVNVPCLTPNSILRRGAWSALSVDVLMVDTEGMDAEVVRAWMATPGFRPSLLVYEHTHLAKRKKKALLGELGGLGYNCSVGRPRAWQDTICLKEN